MKPSEFLKIWDCVMSKFKKFVIKEKASNVVKQKLNYYTRKHGFVPNFELAHNPELIVYVNAMYVNMSDDKKKLCPNKCKNHGFVYDENVTDAFEFYCANQRELERRYLMEV